MTHRPPTPARLPRFTRCPCCDGDATRVVWENPVPLAPRNWRDFMYGGRQFIDQINECERCGFRYVQTPLHGESHYVAADHSGYSSLASARQRYFRELKALLLRRGVVLGKGRSMLDLGAGAGTGCAPGLR